MILHVFLYETPETINLYSCKKIKSRESQVPGRASLWASQNIFVKTNMSLMNKKSCVQKNILSLALSRNYSTISKFSKSRHNLNISENLTLKRESKYFIALAHGTNSKVVTFFSIHSLELSNRVLLKTLNLWI
jgi:hypothetical protein